MIISFITCYLEIVINDTVKERLADLWKRNAAATEGLKRIVDAQAALAEKQLWGVTDEARAEALWGSYEQALSRVLEIGGRLEEVIRDAGIPPKSK